MGKNKLERNTSSLLPCIISYIGRIPGVINKYKSKFISFGYLFEIVKW